MTTILTRAVGKAIKIVVNTPFAMTCLTYDALERGNEDVSIQHVC